MTTENSLNADASRCAGHLNRTTVEKELEILMAVDRMQRLMFQILYNPVYEGQALPSPMESAFDKIGGSSSGNVIGQIERKER